jgi:cytochrome c oxidase cbb3-type subunit III
MKSLIKAWPLLSVFLIAGVVLMAPAIAAAKPDGTTVFKEKCSMCHGQDGKGFAALKTPDFTDPKWQAGITDDKIIETIKNGKKGTPMPAFSGKLSDDEITAVKDYVRSRGKK